MLNLVLDVWDFIISPSLLACFDGLVLFDTAASFLLLELSVLLFWIIFKLVCCPVGWLIFIGYCCVFLIWIVGLDIIEGRRWGMGWVFFIGVGMSRLFSGGAFLCYGLSIVGRLSEEGGTPCQKRARPDWWYAPGAAGCLNLGVAVSLDWDQFDYFQFFCLCWICPHGFVLWGEPARHLVAPFFSHYPWWGYLFGLWRVVFWYDFDLCQIYVNLVVGMC